MRKHAIALAACLLLLGGLVSQAKAAKTTFLLDWIVYGKHAPFFCGSGISVFTKRSGWT